MAPLNTAPTAWPDVYTMRDLLDLWSRSDPVKMMKGIIEPIDPHRPHQQFAGRVAVPGLDPRHIAKDDPLIASTTGVYSTTYNAAPLYWVVHHSELLQLIPSDPWPADNGIQAITTDEATSAGVAETGAIADTDKPDVGGSFTIAPKLIENAWERSTLADMFANLRGHGQLNAASLAAYFKSRHPDMINDMALVEASAVAGAAGANRTAGTHDLSVEALDRIISNDDEEDTFGGSYTTWFDLYGSLAVDRDSATTWDAYVDHASGVDRNLTQKMLDDLIGNSLDNGAKKENLIILTKRDTKRFISRAFEDSVRYAPTQIDMRNLGGVITQGISVGRDTAFYDEVPIFDILGFPADTIGRIMCIDTETLRWKWAVPTQTLETSDYILLDALKTKHLMFSALELVCTNFKRQGKIRDLTSA
ncbi:MAG: hypothetical protein ABIH03_08830 [Pseudomonadota bacterium]